jgi:hypothetical protein
MLCELDMAGIKMTNESVKLKITISSLGRFFVVRIGFHDSETVRQEVGLCNTQPSLMLTCGSVRYTSVCSYCGTRMLKTGISLLVTASVVYWSEFLATYPEVRVQFPALPDFLISSWSETEFIQAREYN